jgi:uncharacterized protein YegJ (DUF2314 family)
MVMLSRALTVFFAGAAAFGFSEFGGAQGITEKAIRDETARVAKNDALMEAAKRKGQATLLEFLALAKAPKPGMVNFAVKVGLPSRNGLEYVWVRPFESKAGRYSGQLRNTPESVSSLKYGDLVAFEEKDIVDWTYIDAGKMKGNFTACALLKAGPKEDREAFKKQYGLDCALQ